VGKNNFEGEKGRPIVKYRDTMQSSMQKCCNDRDTVWVEDLGGPMEPRIRWRSRFPIASGNFGGGEEEPIVSTETFCRELCKNG